MELIKNFIYPNKNDILDPLTVIIKLFLYSYKSVGTKLSIHNNKLIIQENSIYQGTLRTIYRDTKNDINIIQFPIIFACSHYLSSINKNKYLIIFEKIINSFDKLKETYSGNEILYSIDQIKNIIESFIKNDDFNPITIISNYDNPSNKIKYSIYTHLNTIWTENRLNILFGFINEIITNNSSELINNLLISLSNFMDYIDKISYNIITHL